MSNKLVVFTSDNLVDLESISKEIDGVIIKVTNQDSALQAIDELNRFGMPWGLLISSNNSYDILKSVFNKQKPVFPVYLELNDNKDGNNSKTIIEELANLCKKDNVKPGVVTDFYFYKNFMVGIDFSDISLCISSFGTNDGTPQIKFKPSIGISYDGWIYTSRKLIKNNEYLASEFYKDYLEKYPKKEKPTLNTLSEDKTPARKQGRFNKYKPPITTHVFGTRKGETLSEIATYYGIPYQKLIEDNGIKNPNEVYEGQELKIYS